MYLGLDLSTQKLKALLLTESLHVLQYFDVDFDIDLKGFNTNNGVITSRRRSLSSLDEPDDNAHLDVKCPTILWVAAVDLLLQKMKHKNVNFSEIKAISGCAQQHGSVYWSKEWSWIYDKEQTLCEMFNKVNPFAINLSPVWLDSSTARECHFIKQAVANFEYLKFSESFNNALNLIKIRENIGDIIVSKLTGSCVQERFTLSQILKIALKDTDNFTKTGKISLISNFAASIFLGKYAPIDYGDGSGMNIMDFLNKVWSPDIIEAMKKFDMSFKEYNNELSINNFNKSFGYQLLQKLQSNTCHGEENFNYFSYYSKYLQGHYNPNPLPSLIPSPTLCGLIHPYFVDRYGFSQDCHVAAFTGDNLGSLVGSLAGSRDLIISLGTSDTISFWQNINPTNHRPSNSNRGLKDRCENLFENIATNNCSGPFKSPIDSAHIFAHPISPFQDYMAMIVYRNGSLTRERVIEKNIAAIMASKNGDLDQRSRSLGSEEASEKRKRIWSTFNDVIELSRPGNGGNIGFYILQSEITPRITLPNKYPIVLRYNEDDQMIHNVTHHIDETSDPEVSLRPKDFLYHYSGPFNHLETDSSNKAKVLMSLEFRAMVEGRFLAMRNHVAAFTKKIKREYFNVQDSKVDELQNVDEQTVLRNNFDRIIVSGGAAANQNIIRIMADVFGIPVFAIKQPKSSETDKILTETAALGSGYLAKFSLKIFEWVSEKINSKLSTTLPNEAIPFQQIFSEMTAHLDPCILICQPNFQVTNKIYDLMARRYAILESQLMQKYS